MRLSEMENLSSDQVCPVVPGIHDWDRREATDMVIMVILIGDLDHLITMTQEITGTGRLGVILRTMRDIVTPSRKKWGASLSLLIVLRA